MSKDYFLLLDTETTQEQHVADFGAVIVDRKGKIYDQLSVIIGEFFENEELFWNGDAGHFGRSTLQARTDKYNNMLESGARMLATVAAVNKWLAYVAGKYSPIMTAYNVAFDIDKCNNSGIDLTAFESRFCLWHASVDKWAYTKKYRQFIVENHFFNNPTKLHNMSYSTNAETMSRFLANNPELEDEPHTAIEDVIYYELPLLVALVKNTPKKKWLNPQPFNWRNLQVKNHFVAK